MSQPELNFNEPQSEILKENYSVYKIKNNIKIRISEVKNQMDAVLFHLQNEGFITSLDAFREWNITRLSALIYDLRHTHNMNIESKETTIINRFGHSTTFSTYKINTLPCSISE